MTNWDRVVRSHHARAHQHDGFEFASNPGATPAELASFEAGLDAKLPAEFHGLYSAFNGFGVRSADDPSAVHWFARPLGELPQFMTQIRAWFGDTHAELAARFFPFIDWANGDGLGYLADSKGQALPGLHMFEHEAYRCDPHQDAEEFFSHAPISIEEFLNAV
jgi:hypothetical protein